MTVLDRFRGCLLGGAVGDALGAPVEFMSRDQILARYGDEGISDFDVAYGRRGAITDDTQMTLFTAEGLLRAYHRSVDRGIVSIRDVVGYAYHRWLRTQGERGLQPPCDSDGWLFGVPELHSRRAPGTTCLSALRSASAPGGFAANDSKGCGAVMRMAPVGLVMREQSFEVGDEAGWITHGHPSGHLAAGHLAQTIAAVVDGCSLGEALDAADAQLALRPDNEEVRRAVLRARELARAGESAASVEALGEGWVAEEALAISIYCALVADDFASGVTLAVNHSGDSDSTGAITGNVLGTLLGVDAIPGAWLDQLELRDVIDRLASDLHTFVVENAGPDYERYPPN